YGTLSSHSGSTSDTHNKNEGGHSLGSDVASNENDRQLRLVVSIEDKENYLEHPIPAAPVAQPGLQVPPKALAAHEGFRKTRKINRIKIAKGGHGKSKGRMGYAPNNAPFSPKPKTPPPPKKDNPKKGLRGSKKLKPGALSQNVGHGHCAAIEAIGTYHFELPSGLVIVLNNCHYTRGVISVLHLFNDGFINMDSWEVRLIH
nr:zinc finger, CCHC-type [Tanacetum cinerariifolium]